ncbi:hypothetical protein D3C72_1250950 [compost metagenome]
MAVAVPVHVARHGAVGQDAARAADVAGAHADIVQPELLVERLPSPQQRGADRHQQRGVAAAFVRPPAQQQPRQLFHVADIGVGHQVDARTLGGAHHLDAGFHLFARAQRLDIQQRVVQPALEGQRATA